MVRIHPLVREIFKEDHNAMAVVGKFDMKTRALFKGCLIKSNLIKVATGALVQQ